MTNEELVIRIQAGIDTAENSAQLYEQNRGFIAMIASKYRGYAEFDDLMQEGYLGLSAAVDHWDQAEGVPFISYAAFWIRQSMSRYIERNSPVSIGMFNKLRQYKKFSAWFEQSYGREPEFAESCHFLGISDKEFRGILESGCKANIASLDRPVDEDGDCTAGDLIEGRHDVEGETLDRIQQEQLRAVLWPIVDTLPEKQAAVIRLRYQDGMTLKETGEQIGTTIEGARQYQAKAFRELRRSSRARQLKPFLEDYIDTHAYKSSGIGSFNRTWTSSTEYTALGLMEKGF